MPQDQFLNLLATILGAVGAVYVLKAILRLTPKLTERLSATFFGHNVYEVDSLSAQKADSVVGAGLVLIALIIAIANAAIGPSSAPVFATRFGGISLAILSAVVAYLVLLGIGALVKARHRRATARIITSLHMDEVLEKIPIPRYEIDSLPHFAYTLLHLPKIDAEGPEDLLRRIGKEVGHLVPEQIRFEAGPSA